MKRSKIHSIENESAMRQIMHNFWCLFFNPREFTQNILLNEWSWWKYCLSLYAWYLPINIILFVGSSLLDIYFGLAVLAYQLVIPVINIFVLSLPFKIQGPPWSDIYKVNFAFQTYIAPFQFIVMALVGLSMIVDNIDIILISFLFIIPAIWLIINIFRVLGELYETSPWFVFFWALLIGLLLNGVMTAMINAFM